MLEDLNFVAVVVGGGDGGGIGINVVNKLSLTRK